jgi:hypothetical protein
MANRYEIKEKEEGHNGVGEQFVRRESILAVSLTDAGWSLLDNNFSPTYIKET